jgi:hypothetical protein
METQLQIFRPVWFLLPVLLLWMVDAGQLSGAEVYRYLKKDGTVVYTDTPTSGVGVEHLGSMPETTPEEQKEWEKKQDAEMAKYRQDEALSEKKQAIVAPLKEEYEAAVQTLDHYKMKMRQATGYTHASLVYWRKQVTEQEKVVAQAKKKLEKAENPSDSSLPEQSSATPPEPSATDNEEGN